MGNTFLCRKVRWFCILIVIIHLISCRKGPYEIPADVLLTDGGISGDVIVLKKGINYYLLGKVFINETQTLIIEPGVVIRAKIGQGSNASALIISRGAKILAEGSPQNPIIFTVEGDDLNGSISPKNRGLWGGIIILGNAPVNTVSGESFVEGLPETDPRGLFGGDRIDDNSGILRYVSIRHGGANIGEDNEINGLTLAGVGNKTIVEFVEIFSNSDDGIEIFGGTVNLKNIVVAFCGDDAIDVDYGYNGNIQHVFAVQDIGFGDKIIESNESFYNILPYTKPVILNGTFVGRGPLIQNTSISCFGAGGVSVYNSIFLNQHTGIKIEASTNIFSSFNRLKRNEFEFRGNIFWNVAANNFQNLLSVVGSISADDGEFIDNYLLSRNNLIFNPHIQIEFDRTNPIPSQNLPEPVPLNISGIETTNYVGAFGSDLWIRDWTALYKYGFILY